MDPHEHFVRSLSKEDEQLIIIRDVLYAGNWDEVIEDLRSRQQGKPFVFKLSSRIDEDLRRIERLRDYERAHGVDLVEYLVRGGKYPELRNRTGAGDPDGDPPAHGVKDGGRRRSRAGS